VKKLILYDYLNNKLLELDAFVEGQDLKFEVVKPTAFWLGKIFLVDKEPELESGTIVYTTPTDDAQVFVESEVKVEPETTGKSSVGNGGVNPADKLESAEELPTEPIREPTSARDRRTRKRKAA
jgi:hypothetical protein